MFPKTPNLLKKNHYQIANIVQKLLKTHSKVQNPKKKKTIFYQNSQKKWFYFTWAPKKLHYRWSYGHTLLQVCTNLPGVRTLPSTSWIEEFSKMT